MDSPWGDFLVLVVLVPVVCGFTALVPPIIVDILNAVAGVLNSE